MKAQEIIKDEMARRGLSQYVMADMAGMKRTTVATVLLDGRDMSAGTVRTLVDALDGRLDIGGRRMINSEKTIIREMMRERGLTQKQMAELCGVKNQQNVSLYLMGKRYMRMCALTNLVHAMGEKVVIMFGDEEYEVTG